MPTREQETEDRYIERAQGFCARAGREIGHATPSPLEVVAFAVLCKPDWSRSTWRQNKASLIYYFLRRNTGDALQAVAILEQETELGCKKRGDTTSALRKKAVSDHDLEKLLKALDLSRSQYREITKAWIVLAALTGLRPHEWRQARITREAPGSLTGIYLRVENSKNTNGRAHGEYRHLDLSRFDTRTNEAIAQFCSYMGNLDEEGYVRLYCSAKNLLQRTNKTLFKRSDRWIQLYSARHRYSSEAKLTMDLASVAAAMGHAIDKTATMHYGRRRSASGSVIATPIAEDVSKVRQIAPKANQRKTKRKT